MAEINSAGIPGVGTGILHPQCKNRWRLIITESVPIIDEIKQLVSSQIVRIRFNYHLQLLEMSIEQNLNNSHIHTLVKQLSKLSKLNKTDDIKFVIEELDGNATATGRFMFSGCKLLDHDYELDYAKSDTCQHWMKFSFKETKDLT